MRGDARVRACAGDGDGAVDRQRRLDEGLARERDRPAVRRAGERLRDRGVGRVAGPVRVRRGDRAREDRARREIGGPAARRTGSERLAGGGVRPLHEAGRAGRGRRRRIAHDGAAARRFAPAGRTRPQRGRCGRRGRRGRIDHRRVAGLPAGRGAVDDLRAPAGVEARVPLQRGDTQVRHVLGLLPGRPVLALVDDGAAGERPPRRLARDRHRPRDESEVFERALVDQERDGAIARSGRPGESPEHVDRLEAREIAREHEHRRRRVDSRKGPLLAAARGERAGQDRSGGAASDDGSLPARFRQQKASPHGLEACDRGARSGPEGDTTCRRCGAVARRSTATPAGRHPERGRVTASRPPAFARRRPDDGRAAAWRSRRS